MNVTFKSIKINNFLSIGSAEVSLQDLGFTLVKGNNSETTNSNSSNGSGKSAIFDSIFWTLTGETMRGTSNVVNENTNEGALCELEMMIDDSNYKIVRSKSHSEFGNSTRVYKDDELLSDMIKKSQEIIDNSIVASNPQILGSIIILGQGLPYKFTGLSPSKRKDLLETMTNSSSQIEKLKYGLDVKEGEVKSKFTELSNKLSHNQGEILGLNKSKETLISQKENQISSEEAKSRIEEINKSILENRELIDSIKTELNKSKTDIDSLKEMSESLKSYLWEQESELKKCNEELTHFQGGVCPTCGRAFEVTQDMIDKRVSTETRISQINQTIPTLRTKKSALDLSITNKTDEYNNKLNQISSLDWKIHSDTEDIKKLEESSKVAEDLDSQISNIETDIKNKNIENTSITEEQNELNKINDCVSYLKRQLSRDFKGYILKDVIEFMSSRAKYYSEYMFTNKSVELELSGNKIEVLLNKRNYENLSGGERQRVDMVVQFALRDMLVVTSGFSCNIIVLDEAFDNLDAPGSESLIRLVTSEFSDIDSVFIITHHADIDIPYDNMIVVHKNSEGVSNVEGM